VDAKRSDPPRDEPMIPKTGVSATARAMDEQKASKAKREPDRAQTDDERIDEASRESFPASDPPAQP
jgi:hypothetical protein